MSFPVQSCLKTQSAAGTTTAATFGSNNTAGNIIVVGVGYYGSSVDPPTATLSSLTDSRGNVYTLVQGPMTFFKHGPMYFYWCSSCAGGANTITATWSGSLTFTELIAVEYPALSNPHIDTSTSANSGESTVSSLSVGPINIISGDYLISYFRGSSAGTHTIPSGMTQEAATSAYSILADQQSPPSGLTSVTWSCSVAEYEGAFLVAIRAGAPPPYTGPTFVQSTYALGTNAQSLSVALPGAITAGDTLVASVFVTNVTANYFVNGLTDTSGNRWKFLCWSKNATGGNQMMTFCAQNVAAAAAGGNTVTIVFPGTAPAASDIQIAEYTGALSIDTVSGATGSGTGANGGLCNLQAANELLVSFVHCSGAGSPSVSGGPTLRQTTGSHDGGLADLGMTSSGSYSFGFTVPNGNWIAHTIALSLSTPRTYPSIAPLPPMGWDSWMNYELTATESAMKAQAAALASNGLVALGYNLFNINGILYSSRSGNNLTVNTSKFPDGDTATWTYIKSKGLTPAYYLGPGTTGCGGFPGSQGHEATDVALAISQGATFIMYDNCTTWGSYTATQQAFAAMQAAIAGSSNPNIQYLVSAGAGVFGDDGGSIVWAPQVGGCIIWSFPDQISHETPHIMHWADLVNIVEGQIVMSGWVAPGRWNMPQYMGVGNGLLTDAEGRSNFALYAILAAPLWISCDVTTITPTTLATLSNTEIIAIDQDSLGAGGTRYSSVAAGSAVVEVWAKPLSNQKWAVCLWNQDSATQTIAATWSMFSPGRGYYVRDVWAHSDLGPMLTGISPSVPSHDVAMYVLTLIPFSLAIVDTTVVALGMEVLRSFPMVIVDSSVVALKVEVNRRFPLGTVDSSAVTLGLENNRHFPLGIVDASSVTLGIEVARRFPFGIVDSSVIALNVHVLRFFSFAIVDISVTAMGVRIAISAPPGGGMRLVIKIL
jgi:alpha-galactosidase